MRTRLLVGYVVLAAVVLFTLELPLGLSVTRNERSVLVAGLRRDATALAALADEGLARPDSVNLRELASRYRDRTGANAAIVDRGGRTVVALKLGDSEVSEPRLRRVLGAILAGRPSNLSGRFVDEGIPLLYVVRPVGVGGEPNGAVLITYPTGHLDSRAARTWWALASFALAVLAVAALVGNRLARSFTRPLGELERAAGALGQGDLAARAADLPGPSELRDLGRQFNTMAARLQELVSAQQEFVADASHQLRTPLTALRLRLENLQPLVIVDGIENLNAALDECNRLSRIVDGLLALARAEVDQTDSRPVDIAAVVLDRCRYWSPLAEEREVTLRIETQDIRRELVAVVPGHLEQILDNLLANALDAAPTASVLVIQVIGADRSVTVHIRDSGSGMTSDERARAFDRYWRGPGSLPDGRSGLGLAIVHQLVRANGGLIELLEEPGGGLHVVVTFPQR